MTSVSLCFTHGRKQISKAILEVKNKHFLGKHHKLHHISWKDLSVGSVRVTYPFRMYLPKSIRICPSLCYKYVEDRNSSILGDCYLVSSVPTHSRVTQYTALGHTVGTQYTALGHTIGTHSTQH